MLEDFTTCHYRVVLSAGEQGLELPPYKGSTLRGGFGAAFRRIACSMRKKNCRNCLIMPNCPYTYVFETTPPPGSEVLRLYTSIPRPFVIEPPLVKKTEYNPGERLEFRLILIGKAIDYFPYFVVAFQELGINQGIGRGRRPYNLENIYSFNPLTGEELLVYEGKTARINSRDLRIAGKQVMTNLKYEQNCLRLRFETMTRIKYQKHLTEKIEFHMLIRNLLRRLSSLYYFHHECILDLDFKGLISRAQHVKIIEDTTRWEDWERFSRRQNTRMKFGGVVGDITYQGDLEQFLPFIKLGELIHVGKGTVFGLGKYTIL